MRYFADFGNSTLRVWGGRGRMERLWVKSDVYESWGSYLCDY